MDLSILVISSGDSCHMVAQKKIIGTSGEADSVSSCFATLSRSKSGTNCNMEKMQNETNSVISQGSLWIHGNVSQYNIPYYQQRANI